MHISPHPLHVASKFSQDGLIYFVNTRLKNLTILYYGVYLLRAMVCDVPAVKIFEHPERGYPKALIAAAPGHRALNMNAA